MKVGIVPINVGVDKGARIAALARKAEEVGLESAWTFEHVIVPVDYESRYPYSPNGKMAASPETPFIDPLIAITYAAAATKTLRFGTGVNILPQANPLFMAKQVASIDAISGGRMMLGVGIGWLREEFEALGTPFERRGARFDDYITAMKKVWSEGVVEHDGAFVKWSGFKSYPLPVQRPHPPIIIGGSSDKALQRVVRHGDGWFAPKVGVKQADKAMTKLREAAHKEGRDPDEIEVSTMWIYAGEGIDTLAQYEDLGIGRLIIPLQGLGEGNPLDNLDKLGEALAKRGGGNA